MKDNVSYEEFLAVVYEAENDRTESKLFNVKAKAMTIEKIIDDKERNDLKDLKQQIESLSMIMKSATVGSMKPKGIEEVSSPHGRKSYLGTCHRKGCRDHLREGRYL